MRYTKKIGLFWALSVLCASTTWAQLRPLVERAFVECDTSYFQALKPTPEEVQVLVPNLVSKVADALWEIEIREISIERATWRNQIINPKVEAPTDINQLRSNLALETQRQILIRDKCWNMFMALPTTYNDHQVAILTTAQTGPALKAGPALLSKILKKGGNIDGSVALVRDRFANPKVTDTAPLFPLLIAAALEKTKGVDFSAHSPPQDPQRMKRQYISYLKFLVANVRDAKTLNMFSNPRFGVGSQSALAYAVEAPDDDVIQVLLDAGADPLVKNPFSSRNPGKTLIDAYRGKDVEVIKRLSGVAIKFKRSEVDTIDDWNIPSASSR